MSESQDLNPVWEVLWSKRDPDLNGEGHKEMQGKPGLGCHKKIWAKFNQMAEGYRRVWGGSEGSRQLTSDYYTGLTKLRLWVNSSLPWVELAGHMEISPFTKARQICQICGSCSPQDLNTHIHIHVHTHAFMYTRAYMRTCMHPCIHIYSCTCKHTHIANL